MNTEKNDRYLGTHTKIIKAFHKLMLDDAISVTNICQLAKINRSSFYLHFENIEVLYQEVQKEIFGELIDQYMSDVIIFEDFDSFVTFAKHVKKYQEFYRLFFLKNEHSFPVSYGSDAMLDRIIKPYFESKGIYDNQIMKLKLACFQAGLTITLKLWVESGCTISCDEVAYVLNETLSL